MNTFISCDWGTSAFRLRLVDAATRTVSATIKTEQGIAQVYNEWQSEHQDEDRFSFYRAILANGIRALEHESSRSLTNMDVVISGMASSSIGMIELPYKALPLHADGMDVSSQIILPAADFQHPLLFISGAKTGKDVMRGEETKLVGSDVDKQAGTQLLILPGTHTKHILVEQGIATDFNTYMTGELFHLLSTKSVLVASVEQNESTDNTFFLKGVAEAANGNLLNSIFHVRTSRLFNYHSPQQNYHYLSGLVIGSELKILLTSNYNRIVLVATSVLASLYQQALQSLHITIANMIDADEALVAGQCKVYLQLKKQ